MANDFGFIRTNLLPQVGSYSLTKHALPDALAHLEKVLKGGTLNFLAIAENRADTEPFANGAAAIGRDTAQLAETRQPVVKATVAAARNDASLGRPRTPGFSPS